MFRPFFVRHKIRTRVLDLLQKLPFFLILSNKELHPVVLLKQRLHFLWNVAAILGRHAVVLFTDERDRAG